MREMWIVIARRVSGALLILGGVLLVGLLVLANQGIESVDSSMPPYVAGIVAALGLFQLIRPIMRIRSTIWRRGILIVTVPMLGLMAAGGLWFAMMLEAIGNHEWQVYQSPINEHRVIVVESGFLETSYTAYPHVFGPFYRDQDNAEVWHRDVVTFQPAEIEWREDSATVYIIYNPAVGRVEEDSIVVTFNGPAKTSDAPVSE